MNGRDEKTSGVKKPHHRAQQWLHFYFMLFIGVNIIIWSCHIWVEHKGWLYYLGLGVIWISLSPYFLFETEKQNLCVARTIGLALIYLLFTVLCAIDWTWEIRILVIAIELIVLAASFLVQLWIDRPIINKNQ